LLIQEGTNLSEVLSVAGDRVAAISIVSFESAGRTFCGEPRGYGAVR
jgi:hypothetical protein